MITLEQYKQLRRSGLSPDEIKNMGNTQAKTAEPEKKQSLLAGIGTGIAKGIGSVGLGAWELGGKAVQTLLPKKAEEAIGLPSYFQKIEEAKQRIAPTTTAEKIGSVGTELAFLFLPTPIKGVGLPKIIAQSGKVGNVLNNITKIGTKGALEFGAKEAVLTGGDVGAVKKAAMFGAGGELVGAGLGKVLNKLAPSKLLPIQSVITPTKVQPKYVPKPRVSPADFKVPDEYAVKGFKVNDLLKKYQFPNSTPEEVFKLSSDKLKDASALLSTTAKNIKKPVNIKQVISVLDDFAKKQETLGLKGKADFANKLKMNLEYSSPEVLSTGKMSVEDAIKWKQWLDKAKFEDPAVAQVARETYKVAGNEFRKIINDIPDIKKIDGEINELLVLNDTMKEAIPQVSEIIKKNAIALERAEQQAILDNARQVEIYQKQLQKAVAEFNRTNWQLPSGIGPKQVVEMINYFIRLVPQKSIQSFGIETGNVLFPTNSKKTQ